MLLGNDDFGFQPRVDRLKTETLATGAWMGESTHPLSQGLPERVRPTSPSPSGSRRWSRAAELPSPASRTPSTLCARTPSTPPAQLRRKKSFSVSSFDVDEVVSKRWTLKSLPLLLPDPRSLGPQQHRPHHPQVRRGTVRSLRRRPSNDHRDPRTSPPSRCCLRHPWPLLPPLGFRETSRINSRRDPPPSPSPFLRCIALGFRSPRESTGPFRRVRSLAAAETSPARMPSSPEPLPTAPTGSPPPGNARLTNAFHEGLMSVFCAARRKA